MVFLSGCIDNGRTKTEIVSKDMLKIKSIDFFPSKDLQPEDTIIIRMEVENDGQESTYLLVDRNSTGKKDGKSDINWNGDALLIDHCPSLYNANTKDADFQILSGGTCTKPLYTDTTYTTPAIPLVKDSAGNEIGVLKDSDNKIITDASKNALTACYLKIPPDQSHTFQWSMKAPSSNRIADMTHKCTFKFQTAYAAKAITNTYVYFADPIEVAQRIYAQKDMTQVGDNIASYGPVAVNFAPAEPQPIPARKNSEWTVFLTVKNVGEGIADVSSINLLTASNIELKGSKLLGCAGLNKINENVALFNTIKGYGVSVDASVMGALAAYVVYCPKETPPNPYCVTNLLDLAKDYEIALCPGNKNAPERDDPVCRMTLSELIDALEDLKAKIQIQKQTTSSIACDITIPEGVTILSPFRFVTTADYTYSIRQDIQITTKPIRESA